MISFAGNAQEAGAGGRSGAAGSPVRGSLMGCFSLCTANRVTSCPRSERSKHREVSKQTIQSE